MDIVWFVTKPFVSFDYLKSENYNQSRNDDCECAALVDTVWWTVWSQFCQTGGFGKLNTNDNTSRARVDFQLAHPNSHGFVAVRAVCKCTHTSNWHSQPYIHGSGHTFWRIEWLAWYKLLELFLTFFSIYLLNVLTPSRVCVCMSTSIERSTIERRSDAQSDFCCCTP